MNRAEFNSLMFDTFNAVKKINESKGREYSGDTDALLNFKCNGANIGLEPTTCWLVYTAKHWDSICTFMRDIQNGHADEQLLSESIDGRFDDLILYAVLGKALVHEWREERERARLPTL